MGIFIVVDQKG